MNCIHPKERKPQQVGESRTCSGYFRSSQHDPWLTLKDQNRVDVEQDGILLCGCRQDAILPYGYFRSRLQVLVLLKPFFKKSIKRNPRRLFHHGLELGI